MMVELKLLELMTDVLKPVAFKAEASPCALAGMCMAFFAVLFLVASPLRRRAWACVLELLVRIVNFVPFDVFGLLVLFSYVRFVNLVFFDAVDLPSVLVLPLAWARCIAS